MELRVTMVTDEWKLGQLDQSVRCEKWEADS